VHTPMHTFWWKCKALGEGISSYRPGRITKASVDALAHGEFLADTEVKGFVVRRLPSGVEIASDFKILIRRGLVLCPRGAGLAKVGSISSSAIPQPVGDDKYVRPRIGTKSIYEIRRGDRREATLASAWDPWPASHLLSPSRSWRWTAAASGCNRRRAKDRRFRWKSRRAPNSESPSRAAWGRITVASMRRLGRLPDEPERHAWHRIPRS